MKRFCRLISDYMGVLVLLSALAALLFPGTIGHLKPRHITKLRENSRNYYKKLRRYSRRMAQK